MKKFLFTTLFLSFIGLLYAGAGDGQGVAAIQPINVVSGQQGVVVSITITAGAQAYVSGAVHLYLPTGWSVLSLSGTDAGYVTATANKSGDLTLATDGKSLTVSAITADATIGTIKIFYGSKNGGGPGATASSAGTSTFTLYTAPSGGAGLAISAQPTIIVSDPTSTITPTITNTTTPTITNTITQTITPTYTPTSSYPIEGPVSFEISNNTSIVTPFKKKIISITITSVESNSPWNITIYDSNNTSVSNKTIIGDFAGTGMLTSTIVLSFVNPKTTGYVSSNGIVIKSTIANRVRGVINMNQY